MGKKIIILLALLLSLPVFCQTDILIPLDIKLGMSREDLRSTIQLHGGYLFKESKSQMIFSNTRTELNEKIFNKSPIIVAKYCGDSLYNIMFSWDYAPNNGNDVITNDMYSFYQPIKDIYSTLKGVYTEKYGKGYMDHFIGYGDVYIWSFDQGTCRIMLSLNRHLFTIHFIDDNYNTNDSYQY